MTESRFNSSQASPLILERSSKCSFHHQNISFPVCLVEECLNQNEQMNCLVKYSVGLRKTMLLPTLLKRRLLKFKTNILWHYSIFTYTIRTTGNNKREGLVFKRHYLFAVRMVLLSAAHLASVNYEHYILTDHKQIGSSPQKH